ncbi:hypothetical protein AWENTII_000762 [Aspergillus wentii]
MASALPKYSVTDAPPSYDSILQKIDNAVGRDRSPEKYLAVANTLSDRELTVITNEAKDKPLPPRATVAMAKAAETEKAQQGLRDAAGSATQAAQDVLGIFEAVRLKIIEIGKFTSRIFCRLCKDISRLTFEQILTDSRDLAVDIGQYASSFDRVVVEFCANQSNTVEQGIAQIETFIAKADGLETKGKAMKTRFETLGKEFGTFVVSFNDWAKDKQEGINKEVQALQDQINGLNEKVNRLEKALEGLGLFLGVGLPVLAAGIALSGRFAPLVGIVGLTVAIGTAGSIAGIASALLVFRNQIRGKENQINKRGQITQIQDARNGLTKLGTEKLTSFSEAVNMLSGFWQNVAVDARAIRDWLKTGADFAVGCPL